MPQSQSPISDDFYDDEEDLISNVTQPLIDGDENCELKDGPFPRARQVFAAVGFCGFAIVYAMRVNLSISIVSMINQTAINKDTNRSITDSCPIPTPTTNSSIPAVSNFCLIIISGTDNKAISLWICRKTASFYGMNILKELFLGHSSTVMC